ncbi:MAG: hypothetical protein ABWJ98_05695 [Hydrogenothermaceae bacterium]
MDKGITLKILHRYEDNFKEELPEKEKFEAFLKVYQTIYFQLSMKIYFPILSIKTY